MKPKVAASAFKMDIRGAPGHPVKYLFHRSYYDCGPQYRTICDWQFDKSRTFYRKNLLAHFGCVNAIEFSKNGSLLASGGDDRRILLWNMDKVVLSNVEPTVMRAEHLSNVFSIDFSCSATKIISAGNDDQVTIHDVQTAAPLDYFVHEQPVYGVSANPENENVFSSACDDGRILIFDIRDSGTEPFCLAKVGSAFHSVMFHPIEPRLLVTANSKEGIASWDMRMPKRIFVKYGSAQNSSQCCMSARFNRLGNRILVLRRRLPPILYATETPLHLFQFNHRGYYNSCTMKSCSFAGQNDQFVLSGSDNFDLHLWRIPAPGSDQWVNRADTVLRGHRSIVNQVRYNYAHNVIASSGVEKLVKLWSPFPMLDEPGKAPSVETNEAESERHIYTPDDYVSLVMQSGHGQFMSLTYEAGRKTTREDSRMLAFFDALVQRDISGLSDEDSDPNFPETTYTNMIYSSPAPSSSDHDDDDSNPPTHNFRTNIMSADSTSFVSMLGRGPPRQLVRSPTPPHPLFEDLGESYLNNTTDESENNIDSSNRQPPHQPESSDETENCGIAANKITQLILEKEENRRKLSASGAKRKSCKVKSTESDTNKSSSDAANNVEEASTSRAANVPIPNSHRQRNKRLKKRANRHREFKNQSLGRSPKLPTRRRREVLSTPVYESTRNGVDSTTNLESSLVHKLMTRNQTVTSNSSIHSSSSSSSESSSSDERKSSKSKPRSKDPKKKVKGLKRARPAISSDGDSSTDADNEIESSERRYSDHESDNRPSTSHAVAAIDAKRKRRPACKLNEACKALFQQYAESSETSRDADQVVDIPYKRIRIDENSESPNTSTSMTSSSASDTRNVEPVKFNKVVRNKGRNYRKNSVNGNTLTDSGIDVSKEAMEPCCSKQITNRSSASSIPSSSTSGASFKNASTIQKIVRASNGKGKSDAGKDIGDSDDSD